MDALSGSPPKMTLARVDRPDEFLTAQANPPDFTETCGAEWAKQKVPGLSHSVKQFVQTTDTTIDLALHFVAMNRGRVGIDNIVVARQLLKAFCRPRSLPGNIGAGGAPRLIFLWPNFFSMVCNLENVKFEYKRFIIDGRPVEMTATLKLEELRFDFLSADEDDPGDIVL